MITLPAGASSSSEKWDKYWEQEALPPWDPNQSCTQLLNVIRSGEATGFSALDLGCGSGSNAIALIRAFSRVVGIDVAQGALDRLADSSLSFPTHWSDGLKDMNHDEGNVQRRGEELRACKPSRDTGSRVSSMPQRVNASTTSMIIGL